MVAIDPRATPEVSGDVRSALAVAKRVRLFARAVTSWRGGQRPRRRRVCGLRGERFFALLGIGSAP